LHIIKNKFKTKDRGACSNCCICYYC